MPSALPSLTRISSAGPASRKQWPRGVVTRMIGLILFSVISGFPLPGLWQTLRPRVADVMKRNILSVSAETTAAEALGKMDEHNVRLLPVLEPDGRVRGLVSLFKVSKFLFPAPSASFDSRRLLTSLSNLARTLNGKLLLAQEAEQEED